MSEQTVPTPENLSPPLPYAKELGDLREHFAPISMAANLPNRSQTLGAEEPFVDRRSPLPLDEPFVQQTKDQIRNIVNSIDALSNAAIEPKDFLQTALQKIVAAMAAHGAAVWEHRDQEWSLVAHHQLPPALIDGNLYSSIFELEQRHGASQSLLDRLDLLETDLASMNDQETHGVDELTHKKLANTVLQHPTQAHRRILDAVANEKQPVLIPPSYVTVSANRPTNPVDDLLIIAPLSKSNDSGQLWLQVVQSASGGPSSQRGYLRFVAQMAEKLSEYFRTHRMRMFERDRACLRVVEQTMNTLSESASVKAGLAKLMNALRQHAGSEHAFLLRRNSRFGKWRLEAAAGLVDIDRRADGIGQIERVAVWMHRYAPSGAVCKAKELQGNLEQRDPDLTIWLNTFAVSRFAWIQPLQASSSIRSSIHVAILLVWSGEDEVPAHCCQQCSMITRLGLSALQLPWWKMALAHHQNESISITTRLHPSAWSSWFRGAICLLVAAVVLLFPVPIKMHATATLLPTLQQHVYAPQDCIVEQVMVEHGDKVRAGQVLVKLRSASLIADLDQTLAEHARKKQQREEIEMRLLRDKSLTTVERDELEGEKTALESTLRIEQRILAGLEEQLNAMQIVATIDGVVATWNLKETLRDRPVRMGQWLLTLHDEKSDWFFEASFPEQEGNEFQKAIRNSDVVPIASLNASPQTLVPLRYSKESNRIDNLVHARNEGAFSERNATHPVLRVRFEVDSTALPEQGIAAGANARVTISTGKGPLFWALSKDMIRRTWAQLRMWI